MTRIRAFDFVVFALWVFLIPATPAASQEEPVLSLGDEESGLLVETEGPMVTDGEFPAVETRGRTDEQIFRLGNEAYESDDLETACAYYLALIDRGLANGALYFNLGNVYFRIGDFGRAVLYYHKAAKLRPRDPNLAHNLDYARTFLIDEPIRRPERAIDTFLILHTKTTEEETYWALAFLNLLLVAFLLARLTRLRFSESVSFGYLRGAVVLLFTLQAISAGVKFFELDQFREGVVLADGVKAKNAPTSEEVLAEINSGTKVKVMEIRDGYAHIELPNGTPAYVPDVEIAEI